MHSATDQLMDHIAALQFQDLPTAVVERAKTFIVDSIGVALTGHRHPLAAPLLQAIAKMGFADEVQIWGTQMRLPAAHAAMANAFLIHCQEFDCVHEAAVVHPMAVVLSCLLAEAERHPHWSGADLILGVVVAVDIAATLGIASQRRLHFFRPAQASGLAAAGAIAKLRGMDKGGIRNAMGVMLGQLSGTMQAHREGASLLPMQIGFAARNAITSVDLAAAGLIGPHEFLEGEFGYLPLFEQDYDLAHAVAQLHTHAILRVSHKPYPSGRATHAGLQGLQKLLQTHALKEADIAQVRLFAPPLIRQLVDRPAVPGQSAGYLKLCFAYCAASMLHTGTLGISDFETEALQDQQRVATGARCQVLADDNQNPNALAPVRVEVETHSGSRYEAIVMQAWGHPEMPLHETEHRAKFFTNWRTLAWGSSKANADANDQTESAASAWLDRAAKLEKMPSARQLLADLPQQKRP
jgi:aconitate decarboxylase